MQVPCSYRPILISGFSPGHKDRSQLASYICGLTPNGNAARDGHMKEGNQILEVNGTFAGMLGYTKDELQGARFTDLREHEITQAEIDAHQKSLIDGNFTPEYERQLRRSDGRLLPVSAAAWLLKGDGER